MTIKIVDESGDTVALVVNGKCIGDRTYLSRAIHAISVCLSNSLQDHFGDKKQSDDH